MFKEIEKAENDPILGLTEEFKIATAFAAAHGSCAASYVLPAVAPPMRVSDGC